MKTVVKVFDREPDASVVNLDNYLGNLYTHAQYVTSYLIVEKKVVCLYPTECCAKSATGRSAKKKQVTVFQYHSCEDRR